MKTPHRTDDSQGLTIPDHFLMTENGDIWIRGCLGTLDTNEILLDWEIQYFSKANLAAQKYLWKLSFTTKWLTAGFIEKVLLLVLSLSLGHLI